MLSVLHLLLTGAAIVRAAPTPLNARAVDPSKSVIIQMFEWNWNSVAQECTSFIGPAGYGYVQVSPATEHIQGDQWWTSYQQVSFQLQSKRGSRAEFASMVNACNSAGVGVLVDGIFNHMAGLDGGTGVAGTGFSHYSYSPNFGGDDFHYCGTPGNDITTYDDLSIVQNCELSNLADLKTESEHVRSVLAAHANDLLSLGVAGFRLDAAKHVPVADLQNIFSRLSRTPVITSEVIGTTPIAPEAYNVIGDVIVSNYYEDLKAAFTSAGIASLQNLKDRYSVPSNKATVHITTHDSERWLTSLTQRDGSSTAGAYALAHVFMLTYPYGHTPTVLSSFTFSNNDAGAPNGGYGTCDGAGGTNGFVCQHRWAATARVVPFFNALAGTGADLNNWQSSGTQRVAYGRGTAGFVLLNNEDGEWSAGVQTALADGTYCDLLTGGKAGGACAGTSVTVASRKVQTRVPARLAIVLSGNAKL